MSSSIIIPRISDSWPRDAVAGLWMHRAGTKTDTVLSESNLLFLRASPVNTPGDSTEHLSTEQKVRRPTANYTSRKRYIRVLLCWFEQQTCMDEMR